MLRRNISASAFIVNCVTIDHIEFSITYGGSGAMGAAPSGIAGEEREMLREAFADRLKTAMRARDQRTTSTVRLILAALKDRDIAQRSTASPEPLGDPDILRLLQAMIKQRRESAALYEQGKRPELAAQEREEIAVIESFLPEQMGEAETEAAVQAVIAETGAAGMKDMGKVMAALRERHSGTIDLARAGGVVKRLLG